MMICKKKQSMEGIAGRGKSMVGRRQRSVRKGLNLRKIKTLSVTKSSRKML